MAVIKIVPMPGAEGQKGDTGAAGPQGPQGATGAQGPAGADAVWYYNGAYNPGASYAVGDVVTYEGQTWYRKNANGGNVGDTPSEGPFWDLIAAKGEQGLTGLEGPQGEPGEPGTSVDIADFQFTNAGTGLGEVSSITIMDHDMRIQTGKSSPEIMDADIRIQSADNITMTSVAHISLSGTAGEFLGNPEDPNNQIATIGDIENAISQSGSLTYKSGAVPATHHGVAGDTKNDIKYDDTHMYICVADYTDGSAAIWKRINWASGNW